MSFGVDQKVPVFLSRKFATSTFVQESARAAQWGAAGVTGVTGVTLPFPLPFTGSTFSMAGSEHARMASAAKIV